AALRRETSGPRMKSELLEDLAAYQTPGGDILYVAVWAERRPADRDTMAYIAPWSAAWNAFREKQKLEGFAVVSYDMHSNLAGDLSVVAVLRKGNDTSTHELLAPRVFEAALDGELAGKTLATIDLSL